MTVKKGRLIQHINRFQSIIWSGLKKNKKEWGNNFVELTSSEHRKVGNYNLLHPKRTGSWRETKELMRQNKRRKVEYWKNRMKDNKTERRIETWKK